MAFNLSQFSLDERAALQHPQPLAIHSHEQELELAIDTAWEFTRLLGAQAELQGQWRDWVCQQLLAMDDPLLVARLTQRLSSHIRGAGQSTSSVEQS